MERIGAIRSSILCGAASAALLVGFAGPATAALVFGVSPGQANYSVLQNTSLIATFTATMSMASTAPDVKMKLLENTLMTTSIVMMQGGDPGDQIGAGRLVPGGTCFTFNAMGMVTGNTIIAPAGSCTFRESFPTADLRLPDPDNIPGLWTVTQTITGQGLDAMFNNQGQFTATITFNATVLDAVGAPEPSTWALMVVGVGGVGASLRARRRPCAKTAYGAGGAPSAGPTWQ